jgi:hypothetical protein
MAAWTKRGLPSAGLYAGPIAWAVSTQANYALVPWVCASKVPAIPALALLLVGISLFGGFLSWRAYAAGRRDPSPTRRDGRPHRFLAAVGTLLAVLFALVIAVHGAAGLAFDGCER